VKLALGTGPLRVHGEICRVRRVCSFLLLLSFPRQKLNEEKLSLEKKKGK
jgi:hypothetical protein